MAEYLGKVTGLVTGSELVNLTGISRYALITSGDIEWLKFKYKGNMLFIASKGISHSTPWYWLNQVGCVYGKDIVINDNTYTCRLMKGGKSDPASEMGGEWKDLIVDLVPDNAISNWSGNHTLCQEIYSTNSNYVICTGNNSVSTFYYFENTASRTDLVWRPVLELKCKLTNSITSQDFGDKLEGFNFNYTITGDIHHIKETINGNIVRKLSNQPSGTEYTLDLISIWDNLDYGKNTVLITATDSNDLDNTVSITFNKVKPPIVKPPTNINLINLVDFTKEINDELKYQSAILRDNLIKKGVECSDTDKMSSLINKIDGIVVGDNVVAGETIKLLSLTPTISMVSGGKLSWSSNVNGSIKIKIMSVCNNSGSYSSLNIDLLRDDSIVSTKSFTLKSHGSYITIEYDLEGVKLYDVVSIYPKNGLVGANPGGIVISCDKL